MSEDHVSFRLAGVICEAGLKEALAAMDESYPMVSNDEISSVLKDTTNVEEGRLLIGNLINDKFSEVEISDLLKLDPEIARQKVMGLLFRGISL